MFQKLLWLSLAGAVGTLARYGLTLVVQRATSGQFPWGTLAVNVAGCFLAGFFWVFSENRVGISGEVRTIILIGFFGAFTTFATFALETSELIRLAQWAQALGNVLLQNATGIASLWCGVVLGRLI